MERDRTWLYGREIPKFTMKDFFRLAGLKNIKEFSVGAYAALNFWGREDKDIKYFYDSIDLGEITRLNQGYLLFTYGEK
jgi:hypothetical protein